MPCGYMIKHFGFVLASQFSYCFLNLNTVKKNGAFIILELEKNH